MQTLAKRAIRSSVRSFAITVDGKDRTPHFQVTATEAWGPLHDVDAGSSARHTAPETHTVAARICSARGTCAHVTASVRIEASPAVSAEPTTRRETLLDLLLRAARRILIP